MTEIKNAIENYLQHSRSCASLVCANCGSGIDGHPLSVYCVKGFVANPCSCGLDAALAAVNRWQPIATAPKDGTPILIAVAGGPVERGYWWTEDETSVGHWFISNRRGHNSPTHWMHLPAPPQIGSGPPDAQGREDERTT